MSKKTRLYIKIKGASSCLLTIRQGPDGDIYIEPVNSVYYPYALIESSAIGDNIIFKYEEQEGIHHFSLHPKTGQQHVKIRKRSKAIEPILNPNFKPTKSITPLLSIVATDNAMINSTPDSASSWCGYEVPSDCNYAILDISAFPKNSDLSLNLSLGAINNEHQSVEYMNHFFIELDDCMILVIARCTNYEHTNIDKNIVFRQTTGKSIVISRVTSDTIFASVTNLQIGTTTALMTTGNHSN